MPVHTGAHEPVEGFRVSVLPVLTGLSYRVHTPSRSVRYCIAVAGVVLAFLAAVALFNGVMDAFGMFRWVKIEGVNAYKPAIYTRVRLFKAYEVERMRPQSIVLGSSRTHVGIRCSHPGWKALPGPCYNLAFDGATTREMYAYLEHANGVRPLKTVILGLDAYHLSSATSIVRPDFDPEILFAPGKSDLRRWIAGDLRILISIDTLQASIEMWRRQAEGEPNWFAPDGQRLGEVFFRRKGEQFVEAGQRAYFDEIDRLEVGFQTEAAAPARPGSVAVAPTDESSLAYVRRIVDFCRKAGIDLRIFITPSHVHQQEIAAATGAWPSLEEGKRALVRLLAEDTARHPSLPPIPAYDFSGYSAVTEESLPASGSHDEMRYYWDSSHFKSLVGDYALDQVLNDGSGADPAPNDFGVRLTVHDIESVIAEQRRRQADYRTRFPEDVSALRSLIASALVGQSR